MKKKRLCGRETNIPERYILRRRTLETSYPFRPIPDDLKESWELLGFGKDFEIVDTMYKPHQVGYLVAQGSKRACEALLEKLTPPLPNDYIPF